ncbi:MAG: nucleotidyltransferase domain-containing protein [bacterium]
MKNALFKIPKKKLAQFCQRWKVSELALFGSALREDFDSHSDVDILITFDENADWGLWEHIQMRQELETLWRRPVDLVSKRALMRSDNWLLRQEILSNVSTIYKSLEDSYAP